MFLSPTYLCSSYRVLLLFSSIVLEICDQPADQTISEGGKVTLVCSAAARNGQPTYRWLHNNREITLAESSYTLMKGELMIERAAVHHSGKYECLVELKHALTDEVILSEKSRVAKVDVRCVLVPLSPHLLTPFHECFCCSQVQLSSSFFECKLTSDIIVKQVQCLCIIASCCSADMQVRARDRQLAVPQREAASSWRRQRQRLHACAP